MDRRVFLQGVTAAFAFAAAGPVATLASPRISISLGSHPKIKGHVTCSVYYKTIGGTVPHIDNLIPRNPCVIWQRGAFDVGNGWFRICRTHLDYEGQEIVFETPDADTSEMPWGPQIEYFDPPTPYIETTARNISPRVEVGMHNLMPYSQDFGSKGWPS